jgi:hypothetical protein
VDRDAIARAQRLRQAREALDFERDRTTTLQEQIEEIVAEADGPRVDEEAFARMTPEDAAAVRAILQPESEALSDDDWLGVAEESAEEPEPDATGDYAEEEIARLEAAVLESRHRQEVLERYIEALGG